MIGQDEENKFMNQNNFPTTIIKIDYASVEWLKTIALNHLDLKNINKLRDRFEGQLYLDIFLKRSFLELALEKYLGIKLIDREKKQLLKEYVPKINIEGKGILLVPYFNGENPKITSKPFECAIFALVSLEARQVEITGFLDRIELGKYLDSSSLSPMASKGYLGIFKDFSKILPISELK